MKNNRLQWYYWAIGLGLLGLLQAGCQKAALESNVVKFTILES